MRLNECLCARACVRRWNRKNRTTTPTMYLMQKPPRWNVNCVNIRTLEFVYVAYWQSMAVLEVVVLCFCK